VIYYNVVQKSLKIITTLEIIEMHTQMLNTRTDTSTKLRQQEYEIEMWYNKITT
jgi:hypothetical protein